MDLKFLESAEELKKGAELAASAIPKLEYVHQSALNLAAASGSVHQTLADALKATNLQPIRIDLAAAANLQADLAQVQAAVASTTSVQQNISAIVNAQVANLATLNQLVVQTKTAHDLMQQQETVAKESIVRFLEAPTFQLDTNVFLETLNAFTSAQRSLAGSIDSKRFLELFRVAFFGAKSGELKALQKQLADVPPSERRDAGKAFNDVKATIENLLATVKEHVEERAASASSEPFDRTLPGKPQQLGHLHPITQTIDELKDLMGRLGFTVAVGPEIEDEWHNFEALNIPAAHPARDPLENFYLSAAGVATGQPLLLRSQTSTVQIRVMENTKPPVRIISLGRVYRPDTADATHYPMFHQIEGLLVDKGVTMADLKSVLRLFASSFLGGDVHIRFRPSFFPFTEPSVEVDMSWDDDRGNRRWIEMGGAGMVDPNVLRAVGYDPEEVTGFAFGLGVERVCARRHNVTDIREFYKNDVRFLQQF